MYPVRGQIDGSKLKAPIERLRMSYVEDMRAWCEKALTAENPEQREDCIRQP